MKTKPRKIKLKKVVPLSKGVHHVELELHNVPEPPQVPIPDQPIELSAAAAMPEEQRHWYDWIVKAVA